jgi:demethylmenaquinone methyltransferase/2-methoxy-6-polyprenyl-1,4-benzoquinol methylase/phosphoethanolamine N-methyltransferase
LTIAAKARAGSAGQVFGIDASPEMIDVARRKAAKREIEIDFRIDLIERLSFPDDHFDVVLSSLMMHHLPHDLKRQGLAEIRRVLRPGGRLLIVDLKRPTSPASHIFMAVLFHRHMAQGVQDLTQLVQEAGFDEVETGDVKLGILGFVRADGDIKSP